MNKNGGNAYPYPLGTCNVSEPNESGGMTMRQYYKAAALQGLLQGEQAYGVNSGWAVGTLVTMSGSLADAMLAEDAEFEARS